MPPFSPSHNRLCQAESGKDQQEKAGLGEPRHDGAGRDAGRMQPEDIGFERPRAPPPLRPREARAHALFDELWEEWVEHAREVAYDCFAYHDCHADSDLERVFLAALMFIRPDYTNIGYGGPLDLDRQVVLRPQHQVGPYRIDFAVIVPRMGNAEEIRIAVECDGQYFHDRTEKQAARDKKRDRYLTMNGWRVVRFVESEIIKDPRGCADQVADLIAEIIERQYEHSRLIRGEAPE